MKKAFLKNILIGILLCSNALFIWKMWNAPTYRHGGPRKEIIARLHFDEGQIRQYDALINVHHATIEKLETRLMMQKQQLFADLHAPFPDSVLSEMLQTEAQMQRIHFSHFKDIEKLCRPDQQAYFTKLNKEIAGLFSPGKKPHR